MCLSTRHTQDTLNLIIVIIIKNDLSLSVEALGGIVIGVM